jgi:hypothetical protein
MILGVQLLMSEDLCQGFQTFSLETGTKSVTKTTVLDLLHLRDLKISRKAQITLLVNVIRVVRLGPSPIQR